MLQVFWYVGYVFQQFCLLLLFTLLLLLLLECLTMSAKICGEKAAARQKTGESDNMFFVFVWKFMEIIKTTATKSSAIATKQHYKKTNSNKNRPGRQSVSQSLRFSFLHWSWRRPPATASNVVKLQHKVMFVVVFDAVGPTWNIFWHQMSSFTFYWC